MPARILAVIAAVAMVAGAIVVRGRMDERKVEANTELRLVCATELEAVCQRISDEADAPVRLTVEPAPDTAQRLASHVGGPDLGLDGWLAPRPWVELVAETRRLGGNAPVLAPVGDPVARTPLVMVVNKERGEVLRKKCGVEALTWRCVGDAAGQAWSALGGQANWGPFEPGFANPTVDTGGLAVLATATSSFFGGAELSTNELTNDDWLGWVQRLGRAAPSFSSSPGAPVDDMLLKFPADFDVVGATESEAGPAVAGFARRSEVTVLYPAPVASVDVVFAGPSKGGARERLAGVAAGDATRDAFAEAGWRVAGRRPVAGVANTPALPKDDGLPSPGFLAALRAEWESLRL